MLARLASSQEGLGPGGVFEDVLAAGAGVELRDYAVETRVGAGGVGSQPVGRGTAEQAGRAPTDIRIVPPSLETLFVSLTGIKLD